MLFSVILTRLLILQTLIVYAQFYYSKDELRNTTRRQI